MNQNNDHLVGPLITIVIPTYNRAALVKQAVTSVTDQTYTNWELMIVDDGSDDGTEEALYSVKDSRIKFLKMPHTGNIALLRNTGVRQGTGEWLAFLDSDDIWVAQKLEVQISSLRKGKKRWGYGGFELINNSLQTIPNSAGAYRPVSGWIIKELLTTEASVGIGTLMLERTLFEEAGGFNQAAELLFREDYEFFIRLALKAEVLAVPEILMRVREHNGRATNAFEHGHDRTATVYEYFLRTNPDRHLKKIANRRMAFALAESAAMGVRNKDYASAFGKWVKALTHGDDWHHLLSTVRRGFAAHP